MLALPHNQIIFVTILLDSLHVDTESLLATATMPADLEQLEQGRALSRATYLYLTDMGDFVGDLSLIEFRTSIIGLCPISPHRLAPARKQVYMTRFRSPLSTRD